MTYPLYPADPARDPAEPFRTLDTAPTPLARIGADAETPWDDVVVDDRPITIEEVAERQRAAFGGPKIGSAFFGWLTASASGAGVVGVLVVVAALLGVRVLPDPWAVGAVGPLDALTVGWVVTGALLAILLAAFYCGGYVAGRMARFSPIAQGVAVWVWALVAVIAVAVAGAALDVRYGILAAVAQAVPRLPVSADLLVIAWIAVGVGVAIVSLGGAILGAVVGVRYHRRVDAVGLDA
ncbi:hypothetical protein ACFPER_14910 [Agromyces aurantiacus]|uniref:Uncharacterized protein n=1 Tax=Agromyces aurantiacus TaxID=165814 RepID=A0ABV9R929_9MICO|nr:hypothetical protein [Agromyces aurantiacus]MBM7505013.1 hypothetical protein [Agromyces aurantiacus]